MNTATIVQKLWSDGAAARFARGLDRSPACEYAGTRKKPRHTLRDDGMSCGDDVEQLTDLPFGCGRRFVPWRLLRPH